MSAGSRWEATYGWEWLAHVLQDAGYELHLAHPLRTKAIASAHVKTDAVDARTLAQLLRADLLPEAYIAPRELRDLRDLLRQRVVLTHMRSALKNRVHALIARQGVQREHADLFGALILVPRRHSSSTARQRKLSMTSIEPELWVERARDVIAFYEAAFGATVLHLVGDSDDVVAQLAVGEARCWISSASAERPSPRANRGATGRVLLVVDDPDKVVAQACAAGALELSPVRDEHGWRLGRIEDPAGHEWEIGRPRGTWPP